MKISIELPNELEASVDQQYVAEALSSILYSQGKISEKEACDISGKNRREFEEEVLPKFGLSILRDTQENIDIELTGLDA